MNIVSRPHGRKMELVRARLEREICRGWREAGKNDWTDAELDRAVSERLRSVTTMPLFDYGAVAVASRAVSHRQATGRAADRRAAVLRLLAAAGAIGATRAELAASLCCQQSSICRSVLGLLRDGEAVEIPRRRQSQHGGVGAVVVLRQFVEAAI